MRVILCVLRTPTGWWQGIPSAGLLCVVVCSLLAFRPLRFFRFVASLCRLSLQHRREIRQRSQRCAGAQRRRMRSMLPFASRAPCDSRAADLKRSDAFGCGAGSLRPRKQQLQCAHVMLPHLHVASMVNTVSLCPSRVFCVSRDLSTHLLLLLWIYKRVQRIVGQAAALGLNGPPVYRYIAFRGLRVSLGCGEMMNTCGLGCLGSPPAMIKDSFESAKVSDEPQRCRAFLQGRLLN